MSFSGKISPWGHKKSEQDPRSRSLNWQPKGLIFTTAQRCQKVFILVFSSKNQNKVFKNYYYYKFKMQNNQYDQQDQTVYSLK